MLYDPPPMFQIYKNNKDNYDKEFCSISSKQPEKVENFKIAFNDSDLEKLEVKNTIVNFSKAIYEKFNIASDFNENKIQNLNKIYSLKDQEIVLKQFPLDKIFIYMKDCGYFKSSQKASITIKNGKFESFSIMYCRVFGDPLNGNVNIRRIYIDYDKFLNISNIKYQALNDFWFTKNCNLIGTIEDESLLMELFLLGLNKDVVDLLPEAYQFGAHVITDDFYNRLDLARIINF